MKLQQRVEGGHRFGLTGEYFKRRADIDNMYDQGAGTSYLYGENRTKKETERERVSYDYSYKAPSEGSLIDTATAVVYWQRMRLDNALDVDENGWLSALPFAEWLRENFIEWLRAMRSTIFSVWLAYTVVWMAYGLRLISSTLLQVGPELEEAARSAGARRGQVTRHVTVPLANANTPRASTCCRPAPRPSVPCWCRCGPRAPSTSWPRFPSSISFWS
ncbi:hypothetical protein G6F31_016992 [Rhizopus arrhizus]|nr:hypothetical protein G6F31_016992 [Rhizopus arrhizus]